MILKYVLASFVADKVAKNEKVKKGLDKAISLGLKGAEKLSNNSRVKESMRSVSHKANELKEYLKQNKTELPDIPKEDSDD